MPRRGSSASSVVEAERSVRPRPRNCAPLGVLAAYARGQAPDDAGSVRATGRPVVSGREQCGGYGGRTLGGRGAMAVEGLRVAVIIPAYRSVDTIEKVIAGAPGWVDTVY